ncbi:PREDICTED: serine/threonine-protein phosphatase 7 long form homolog [Nicotiana attenuata]|uniref:serine/threonine-protein phosphatase 7 long form homolog n=1 Tax=Nicotiana attenuata TaxID=49451 RepID=UPI0009059C4E|nr:PREDICTED: serine/threonine-protein phosphatase 7 long form homolog [Nicotiana attenuata]
MDLSPVHHGPVADQILVLQGDHRSAYVWEGHLLDQTLRARRSDDLWDFLREKAFHARVVHRLRATGFLRIFEIRRMQLDWSLIKASIERWRPETHTFHMPIGEATITLQDVQVLYGLRVDGLAVALPQHMRAMTRVQYLDLLGQYTGFRPQGEAAVRGGSRISVTTIRQHMEVLHLDITGKTEDLHIDRYMRSMCRASMGTQVDICGFLPLLQPPLPPLEPGVAPPFLSLATRWVLQRGNYRCSDAHHNLPLVRDVLDMLVDGQFIWTPYSDELLADLPDYCSVDRLLWSTSVPMMCLDVVEHHATERVLRQFDRPQTIPMEPAWVATHYQRDDRSRVDDEFLGWLEAQVYIWDQREDLIPPPPSQIKEATIELYTSWYRRHTRLMIGNPVHVPGDRFRPYAGRHEAVAVGHHMFYQLGQEMQQHADNADVFEFVRRVEQLALRTLRRAREGARLDHEAEYAAPEEHHRGRHVPRGRGRARARAAGNGEELDEPSSSMPSYTLQLDLPASQVTPSYPSSITGIFDGDVDQFFSGTSTAAEDRPTRDVDGGCRLSYASSPAVDADLPQAQDLRQVHLDISPARTLDYHFEASRRAAF